MPFAGALFLTLVSGALYGLCFPTASVRLLAWVALTKEFMSRTPFVWPVVNIPYPFGGTPLFNRSLDEGRMLRAMPFSFYYSPYAVTVPKHYDPITYYEKLIEIFAHFTSGRMLLRRLATTTSPFVRLTHVVRTRVKRRRFRDFRRILGLLTHDPQFRAFHEGGSAVLPEFYQREYERMLGPFATLMPRRDRIPELERAPSAACAGSAARSA